MNIFQAIYDFIQAARQTLLDILQPLIMPDWGWLVSVILPLATLALVLLWLVYVAWRYRRNTWANADRRIPRLEGRLTPPPGVHASPPSWWPIELAIGFFFLLLGLVAGNSWVLILGVLVLLRGTWGWLRSANREWRRAELSAGHGPGAHALTAGTGGAAAIEAGAGGGAAALVPPSRALVPRGASAVVPVAPGYEHAVEAPPGVHMPAPSWWPVYASAAAFFALLGLVVNVALLAGGIVLVILAVLGWYVDSYRELKVAEGIAPRPHVRDPLAVFPRILATIGVLTVVVSITFAVGPSFISSVLPPQGAAGPGASGACTPTPTTEITAKDIKFSTNQLCLPADTPFQIVFHNDDSIPHNVAIGAVFSGEIFSGVGDRTYDVPAIPAGTYKFICVVHPTVMFGTATVVAAGPRPPGGPGGSSGPGGSPGAGASGSPSGPGPTP